MADHMDSAKTNQLHRKVIVIIVSYCIALCHAHSNGASDFWLENWEKHSLASFYGANEAQ